MAFGVAATTAAAAVALNPVDTVPTRYRALTRIRLRERPDVASPPTGCTVEPGQVFEVAEIVQPTTPDGPGFLRIVEEGGWVFDRGIAGRWIGKPIIEQVEEEADQAEVSREAMVKETLKRMHNKPKVSGASMVEASNRKFCLSSAALNRVEAAAASGSMDRHPLDRHLREKSLAAEQKSAVFAVRRMFQQINIATDEDFTSLKRALADMLETQGPKLGNQVQKLRDESERILQLNEQRINNIRFAQESQLPRPTAAV